MWFNIYRISQSMQKSRDAFRNFPKTSSSLVKCIRKIERFAVVSMKDWEKTLMMKMEAVLCLIELL